MAIIGLQQHEISDVVQVLQNRGIQFACSIESDGAYVYGTDDTIQQVRNILWAAQVLDELGICAPAHSLGKLVCQVVPTSGQTDRL